MVICNCLFYILLCIIFRLIGEDCEGVGNKKAIAAAKTYLNINLMPKIKEIVSLDDIIIVIGGSLSYGFFDRESDVDVYILWELSRGKWFDKLREFLFTHKIVDGFRIQYIPIDLQNIQYAPLSCLLNDNFELLYQCNDIELLYDILHFIPLHDTKNSVRKARDYVSTFDSTYWRDRCIEHCSKHIDVLELFYSSLKRDDALTGSMFYGTALKGLLEIAYLIEGTPYPTEKWVWNGLEKANRGLFDELKLRIANKLPETCEDMRNNVFYTANLISGALQEDDIVPMYIINDLLYP